MKGETFSPSRVSKSVLMHLWSPPIWVLEEEILTTDSRLSSQFFLDNCPLGLSPDPLATSLVLPNSVRVCPTLRLLPLAGGWSQGC